MLFTTLPSPVEGTCKDEEECLRYLGDLDVLGRVEVEGETVPVLLVHSNSEFLLFVPALSFIFVEPFRGCGFSLIIDIRHDCHDEPLSFARYFLASLDTIQSKPNSWSRNTATGCVLCEFKFVNMPSSEQRVGSIRYQKLCNSANRVTSK